MILVIHAVHLCCVLRIFFIGYKNYPQQINYFFDPFVFILIILAIFLHVLRWKKIASEPDGRTFNSGVALGVAAKNAMVKLYAGFEYMIRPMPNSEIISQRAIQEIQKSVEIKVLSKKEVLFLISRVKGFYLAHFGCVLLCFFVMLLGEGLNYGVAIKSVWFLIPFFMCISANLLVFSASNICYFLPNSGWRIK